MTAETTWDYVPSGPAEQLAHTVVIHHPLPWRIESDWGWEVWSSDDFRVAMVPTREDAEAIVAYAAAYTDWLHDDTNNAHYPEAGS